MRLSDHGHCNFASSPSRSGRGREGGRERGKKGDAWPWLEEPRSTIPPRVPDREDVCLFALRSPHALAVPPPFRKSVGTDREGRDTHHDDNDDGGGGGGGDDEPAQGRPVARFQKFFTTDVRAPV